MEGVKWSKGIPLFEGLYLAAVRYPNGLGELDLLHWDGDWRILFDEVHLPDTCKVVGYVNAYQIVGAFSGEWPEWDDEDKGL